MEYMKLGSLHRGIPVITMRALKCFQSFMSRKWPMEHQKSSNGQGKLLRDWNISISIRSSTATSSQKSLFFSFIPFPLIQSKGDWYTVFQHPYGKYESSEIGRLWDFSSHRWHQYLLVRNSSWSHAQSLQRWNKWLHGAGGYRQKKLHFLGRHLFIGNYNVGDHISTVRVSDLSKCLSFYRHPHLSGEFRLRMVRK